MALSDNLAGRVGDTTGKGTKITDKLVSAVAGDEAGLIVIADNTAEIIEKMDAAIARALEAVGIQAEGDAKLLCPEDTGRLRNSITHTIDAGDNTAVIGTNVEYALYVHEGTRKMKGQPFLKDAVTQHADDYRGIIEKYLNNG